MKTVVTGAPLRTAPAAGRGPRLFPPRSSRIYHHLTMLRKEIEAVGIEFLRDRNSPLLLDFGCGNMPYRPLLEPLVQQYLGCDLPGNERADLLIEEGGVVPVETGAADLVFSSQVLEHVADPQAYLEEAHRVLSADGLLILSTHGMWRYHPDPCDFWRWTSDGLKRQLELAGFRAIHFKGVMGPESAALQLWQDAVLPRVNKFLRPWFIRYMQWRIGVADRRCAIAARDRDACVYVVVARKDAGAGEIA